MDILPLLRILEYYFLIAMGLSIIVISIMLNRAGFYLPSALCFFLGGLFSFLWKLIFLVFGETDLTRAVSESFESFFAIFTALGVLFYISHLYAEYSKKLEKQEKELEKSIEKAQNEKNKSEAIIAALGDGIIIQDVNYKIIYQNHIQKELYGDRTGEYCYKAYEGRDEICEDCPVEKTFIDGKIHSSERKIVTDKGISYYDLTSSPLKDSSGKIFAGIKVVREITERKRTEEALRESEEKYRMLIENIQDGAFIIQDAKLQYVNEAFAGMTGYNMGEVIGKDFREFIVEEDKELVTGRYYKRQSGENVPEEYDFRMLHKDRTNITVNMNVGLINYRGKVASMGIIRDITMRKRVEEEKNRLLKAMASSTDGITIADEKDRYIYVNAAYARIFGYAPEDFIGGSWRKITPSDIIPVVEKGLEDTLHNKDIGLFKGETPGLRKDNRIIPTDVMATALWDENKNYTGHICIVRDVTERKRVEEKLREGERFLESIFASIQDGIGIIDRDMNIIRVNKTAESWYPHSVPLIGKKCYEAYHNRKERCELCPARETLKTGKLANKVIPKHGPKGKKIGWLEIYSYPLKDTTTGQMRGVIEYVRDISERKRVENALLESETRYRTLFESASDAIFIIEAEGEKIGHIVATNNAAAEMHGYSKNELLAMNIKDLDTEESSKDAGEIISRILKGETVKIELDHRRKDGTVFPVEISSGLLEFGGHKYILGFDRNITKRKRAEEALRLSNLVVENSLTVLFRWKAQDGWPVEYVSKNVAQFGYKPEDFLSGALLYASIIYPDDIQRVSKEVEEHSKNGNERFQQEYRIVAKNGGIRWIDDRTVIERNREGQITHYQGIILDITERKHIEEAIIEYNIKLEESNRMKELFTDIMHHDLLNPLNVANGYVELFIEDEPNVQKKTYLESIKRNLVRGMELIDNAMKLSKLESMDNIELDDLDLTMVIGEVIENLTPTAVKAGMSIENNLNGRLPVRANKMIGEIFENLITNAIKYAPQGKRIVVNGKDGGNSWSIRIMDFGAGIKDADKKLLFNRFQRQEKKGVKGSGLGLAIAGRIARLHNGRIWVEDNPEGGAVFVVEIQKS